MRTAGCSSKNTLMNDFSLARFFNNYYITVLSIWRCLSEKFALVKKSWTNIFSLRSGQGVMNHLTAEKLQPGWEVRKDDLILFFFSCTQFFWSKRSPTSNEISRLLPASSEEIQFPYLIWSLNYEPPWQTGQRRRFLISSVNCISFQSNWSFIKWKEEITVRQQVGYWPGNYEKLFSIPTFQARGKILASSLHSIHRKLCACSLACPVGKLL